MKSFREIIAEELTDDQKKLVNSWVRTPSHKYYADRHAHTDDIRTAKARGEISQDTDENTFPKPQFSTTTTRAISDHVFPKGQDRITIPLEQSNLSS